MINFNRASLLTFDYSNKFFGDNLFRYASEKNLTIQGNVLDLTNSSGVLLVSSGVNSLINSANDWSDISLNGINFGRAKINSISFDDGNWIRVEKYTVNCTVFESGNLYNLTGAYYGNLKDVLTQPGLNIKFLESLDETFSFTQQKNGLVDFNHNLDVKFISGDDGISPILKSQYIASQIFSSGSLDFAPSGALIASGLLYNLYFPTAGLTGTPIFNKKYYTENYSVIDYAVSFIEKFSYNPNNSDNYFYTLSHSVQTDELGTTNVTENANIRGLISPIYNSALSGYYNLITGSFSRSNSAFINYVGTGGYLLINEPITNGTTMNKFAGTIDYSITYTNSPNTNSGYFWNYTTSIDKRAEIVTASQAGQFIGRGKVGTTEKYQNALQAFNTNFPNISTSIGAIYTGAVIPAKTLQELGGQTEMGNYKGTIGYTLNLSDDPSLIFDGTINKKMVNVSNQKPEYIHSSFAIFGSQNNFGREILQLGSNSTLGSESLDINYNYKRAEPPNVQNLFNRFKQDVQNYISGFSGTDHWVSDCSFSVNEVEDTFQGQAQINYTSGVNPDSVDLDWS